MTEPVQSAGQVVILNRIHISFRVCLSVFTKHSCYINGIMNVDGRYIINVCTVFILDLTGAV